jgi:surfactin synthase thioesterase subunit
MIASTTSRRNPWFLVPRPLVQPRYRLICFPHAGAGASLYLGWLDPLQKAGIELRSVQYPGRESRMTDPPISAAGPLVSALADIWPVLSGAKPTVLFGHSMGGLIVHELAVELARRKTGANLRRLVLSGRNPPTIPPKYERIFDLPDEQFIAAVAARHKRLPQEIFADAELAGLITTALRADFSILDTYAWSPAPPLDIPFTILGGKEDPWITESELAGWSSHTVRGCRIHMISGDHFFHQSSPAEVIAAIVRDLS